MSISHGDFFRLFERAAEGYRYTLLDTGAQITIGKGQLTIYLQDEGVYKIASLSLPSTVVDFTFTDEVSDTEREQFFEQFELSFRRGGG